MTRDLRCHVRAGVLTLVALMASACGESNSRAPAPSPAAVGSDSTMTSPSHAASTTAPGQAVLETPAATSGTLSKSSFPSPRMLGVGWKYAPDPGDGEEGYLGNGTPALERDPHEIVQLAVPFGCARSSPMPAPSHALEVDYTAAGVKVIAIRGAFTDAAMAAEFFTSRAANLDRCRGRSGGQAMGTLVARTDSLGSGVLLSDRTPDSDPWAELAILDGDQVVLIAAQTTLGRSPMTRSDAERLAPLFQR